MDGPLRGLLDPWCRPGRMTTGNSNPLALWMVNTRTASSDSSARALSASSGCSDTLVIIRLANPVKVRWGDRRVFRPYPESSADWLRLALHGAMPLPAPVWVIVRRSDRWRQAQVARERADAARPN